MNNETWRPVYGYEGLYEVSDIGQVRSIALRNNIVKYRPRIKMMALQEDKKRGYWLVKLSKENKVKLRTVHQLVLEAFVSPKPPDLEGAHADGNGLNNRLENLRWATRKENSADTDRHGTRNPQCEVCRMFLAAPGRCKRCLSRLAAADESRPADGERNNTGCETVFELERKDD